MAPAWSVAGMPAQCPAVRPPEGWPGAWVMQGLRSPRRRRREVRSYRNPFPRFLGQAAPDAARQPSDFGRFGLIRARVLPCSHMPAEWVDSAGECDILPRTGISYNVRFSDFGFSSSSEFSAGRLGPRLGPRAYPVARTIAEVWPSSYTPGEYATMVPRLPGRTTSRSARPISAGSMREGWWLGQGRRVTCRCSPARSTPCV